LSPEAIAKEREATVAAGPALGHRRTAARQCVSAFPMVFMNPMTMPPTLGSPFAVVSVGRRNSQNVASAADGAKLIVAVLSEVAGGTTETQQSAQTVLTASESVEKAAANLRSEVESFLTKAAV
jgi:hypothetical protein